LGLKHTHLRRGQRLGRRVNATFFSILTIHTENATFWMN